MRHNEHEIDLIKNISLEMGVGLRLKTVSVKNTSNLKYLPLNKTYRRYKTLDSLTPKIKQARSCSRAWDNATINWDGSTVSCCKDSHRENLFGYVDGINTFHSIWTSSKFNEFRERQRNFRDSIEICKNCVIP